MVKSVKNNPVWIVCLVFIVSSIMYWGFLATDKFVSESNVILESPQVSSNAGISLQSIIGGGTNNHDMLVLKDYILSTDMMRKVEEKFQISKHYSNSKIDFFSRLDSGEVPAEKMHEYYKKIIVVELDEYAQILRIQVKAYSPEYAQNVLNFLLKEGEKEMNEMGRRLAAEQVSFLETQVEELANNLDDSRSEILTYQNEKGLVSPTATVESINVVVSSLEKEAASLKAQLNASLAFQSKSAPSVKRLQSEISAVEKQIKDERSRVAESEGQALNVTSSEYQMLEMKLKFAEESYSAAIYALENTRIEAARKLKQVSVLQSPTLPEYSTEPKRIYNITVSILISVFLTLILHMLFLIIKDHRD